MKLLAVYVVCAVCAGAASSLSDVDRQEVYQALDADEDNFPDALLELAEGNKVVQGKYVGSYHFLQLALNDIMPVLHLELGQDVEIFRSNIHQALTDVKIHMRYITRNLSAIVSEVEASDTISTLQLDNKEIEYGIKRHFLMQICADSLHTVNLILGLIGKTQNMLKSNVFRPLSYLWYLLKAQSTEEMEKNAEILRSKWNTTYTTEVYKTAKEIKSKDKDAYKSLKYVLRNGEWLKYFNKKMKSRNEIIGEIKNIASNSKDIADLYGKEFDQYVTSGDDKKLEEGSNILATIMLQLKDEVLKIKHNQAQRWIAPPPPKASWHQGKSYLV